MKLEKLGRKRKKKIVIGVIVFLCFISALIYTGSRAKYKVTESIPLVNGTINYKPYDMKMMAMYQVNDSGDYTEITKMPESGYAINEEKSYCKVNGEKDDNARLYTNSDGEHVIANLQKNSKCYVWFDVKAMTIPEMVASRNPTEGITEFTEATSIDEGLKIGMDDDGQTYYFRGNLANNFVQFAGFYWHIIRINGDGSMRLIYQGLTTEPSGAGTQISTSSYNLGYNDNAHVGYMYGTKGSSAYEATHANTNNSTIKGKLDNWYKVNIVDKGYSNKISNEAGFCNNRTVAPVGLTYTGDGTAKNATSYGPYSRVRSSDDSGWATTQTPTFKCPQIANDLFTTSSSSKGNKKLIYPVGLITMDETIYAGTFVKGNGAYYLHTNQNYWTMSPATFDGSYAYVFYVGIGGKPEKNNSVASAYGVRPVINLSSDVKLTGSGTKSDPYKVV